LKSIKSGLTLGDRLRQAREKKKLTLADVESQTGIRAKYLSALEEGRYSALPKGSYLRGFLLSYADFLNLPKEKILEIWQKEEKNLSLELPQFKAEKLPKTGGFFITPRLVSIFLSIMLVFSIGGYVFYQVRDLIAAPLLEVFSPGNESVVDQEMIEVAGKTDAGSIVKINEQPISVSFTGEFRQEVYLRPGLNILEITAESRTKKTSYKTIIVDYKSAVSAKNSSESF